jgi:plastocyanin
MMAQRNTEGAAAVYPGVTKHLRILAPLLATAALAAGCGGGSSDSTTAANDGYGYDAPAKTAATKTPAAAPAEKPADKPAGTTVELSNTSFQPQSIDVKVGDTVTFVNKDEIAHTATANDKSFDSKTLEGGATFSFKATKAGKIGYVCLFHPGMTGTINVS